MNNNYFPIPPGSGEGDVPVNILFLLDSSSESMSAPIWYRFRLNDIGDVLLSDRNDVLVGQWHGSVVQN